MRFFAMGKYAHKRFLDIAIVVIKIMWENQSKTKMRVLWAYKNPKRGDLGLFSSIEVNKKDMDNWVRL